MLAPFLIMFREGVEAALIVGIIASYLRQTGRTHLMKGIWIGIILATLMCLVIAIILQATTMGLLFVCFQAWILFALPGVQAKSSYLGQSLLEAA